jgi:hypothetical protein
VPLSKATKADYLHNPSDWRRFAKGSINHLRELGLQLQGLGISLTRRERVEIGH